MYEEGFRWWSMGYATSIAFVLFVIVLALTLVLARSRRAAGEAAA
jgi:multiple sugar transport system permease protein